MGPWYGGNKIGLKLLSQIFMDVKAGGSWPIALLFAAVPLIPKNDDGTLGCWETAVESLRRKVKQLNAERKQKRLAEKKKLRKPKQ